MEVSALLFERRLLRVCFGESCWRKDEVPVGEITDSGALSWEALLNQQHIKGRVRAEIKCLLRSDRGAKLAAMKIIYFLIKGSIANE